MIKNDKLEELKLYITQKIIEEQNIYSKLLDDLNFYVGGDLDNISNIKKILEKIHFVKNEVLDNILQKIRTI